MVDFKYHVVSIIAVFLALAVGIVVGTTALNGAVLDNLQGSVKTLSAEKRTLEGTVTTLRQQTGSDGQLVDRIAPAAVAGLLTDRRVVVVVAPNASSGDASDLQTLLEAAGATISRTVTLRPDLLDPARSGALDTLVRRVAPRGLALPDGDATQRASVELAASLLTGGGATDVSTLDAEAVVDAFNDGDLIDKGQQGDRADLAVLLTGDPIASADPTVPAARARALLSFAAAFDDAGQGAVVTGPVSSAEGTGVIQALRSDGALSDRVSSVDGVDQSQGRVAVVYALREQLDGKAGSYGTGAGAKAPLPSLPSR